MSAPRPARPDGSPRGARRSCAATVRRPSTVCTLTSADGGQALLLLVGALLAVVAGALVLAAVATALTGRGDRQRAADLGALAGARAMRAVHHRVFAPAFLRGRPNPEHLSRAAYLAIGRRSALATAERNGADRIDVSFPGGGLAPVRVRVTVGDRVVGGLGVDLGGSSSADAELVVPGAEVVAGAGAGEYTGPLAIRQGKPMRPDVAQAFDRLDAAARADGVRLVVVSGFRTNAEQARLFAAHPDPHWVARPGHSLHRLGTELDLGPASAYGWLARNAPRHGFIQRYAWEEWHWGYSRSPGTRSVGFAAGTSSRGAIPSFVPQRFAPALRRAASRHSVSAALLAAQLRRESGFDPRARSPSGALGIAQFMPDTARSYGLSNPFDPEAAIDAQARLMRDLLRRFASVPLALAAYNAGPAPVAACMCLTHFAETQAYVADILGLAGAGAGGADSGLPVRLIA